VRDYAIVLPEFWTGRTGRLLRTRDATVRELAFYLFSAPNSSMYGLYYKPLEVMVLETGRSKATIANALKVLAELEYCLFDAGSDFVWVPEMAEIQLRPLPLKTGDWKIGAANRWYNTIPRNPFLGPFFDKYSEKLRLDGPRRHFDGLSGTKQSESEGTIQASRSSGTVSRSSTTSTSVKVPEIDDGFQTFWQEWPKTRRIGKQAAHVEWRKIKPDDALQERIVLAVRKQKRQEGWIKDNGKYIPHPERWLKHHRWEDEVSDAPLFNERTVSSMKAALDFASEGDDANGQFGQDDLLREAGGFGDSDWPDTGTRQATTQRLLGKPEGHT